MEEFKHITQNLIINDYKSRGFEGSSNDGGFILNSKIEDYNFLNTNLILKFNSTKFNLTLYPDGDKGISDNKVSIEFPENLLKSYDIKTKYLIKGKTQFNIGNIQFYKNGFDLEIILMGKFSVSTKFKDKVFYENDFYSIKLIISESDLKIYLIDGDTSFLILENHINK